MFLDLSIVRKVQECITLAGKGVQKNQFETVRGSRMTARSRATLA